MRRQGVDVGRSMREIKHTALGALRGGAAEGIVQTFFAHAETVMRFVRQWASVLGFLVLLCGLCPHLPRDFLDCWYEAKRLSQTQHAQDLTRKHTHDHVHMDIRTHVRARALPLSLSASPPIAVSRSRSFARTERERV